MTVVVRLADVHDDREAIISGLRDHLNPLTDDKRYDWLYVNNPDGPARVWAIEDSDTGKIVGTCSVLPRYVYVHGAKTLGCVIADTWVHPDYRVLGPALKLQRACLADISSGRFELGYDFPRQAMPAVYQRLRIAPHDNLVDYVGLIRLNSILKNRLGDSGVVRLLSRPANFLFGCFRPRSRLREVTIALEDGRCGPEYTRLHEETVGKATCVARTAEYLNWRYRDHFHHTHEFLVARREGQLVGYVVFIDDPYRATGVDLVCVGDDELCRALLISLMGELRRRGCEQLQFSALASDRLSETLQALRFRPISKTPFVLLPSEAMASRVDELNCSFTIGHEAD